MDRPIIFSAPMVRALLDGRKTQTRRVLKPQPEWLSGAWYWTSPRYNNGDGARYFHTVDVSGVMPAWLRALPYAPGDRLWVREGFMPAPMEAVPAAPRPTRWNIAYAAGGQDEVLAPAGYNPMLYNYERWSPSIHMPRWASRLTLHVTAVRVQRLQDISDADARAEGLERIGTAWGIDGIKGSVAAYERTAFRVIWNALHGAGAWDANPWVAAITFTVERANIDALRPAA